MISIIIPVYNVEKYIINCLKSIVCQSINNFELILVNDGSTDDSVGLLKEYLKDKDINWKLINKDNGGLASARNAGIIAAKGEYISFIDADDCIANDFIEILSSNLENNDFDFSFCNFKFVSSQEIENKGDDKTQIFTRDELLIAFLRRNINFVVPSMIFKKDFLLSNNLLFDEKIRFSEDQPFIWNCILHSNKSIYYYKKMYGYYVRENSIMTSSSFERIKKSYEEYSQYIKGIFKAYPQYEKIYKLVIPRWQLGALYTSARILDYKEFKNVYELFDGKYLFKKIIGVKEVKAYALAFVSSLSCVLLYKLSNALNLNK